MSEPTSPISPTNEISKEELNIAMKILDEEKVLERERKANEKKIALRKARETKSQNTKLLNNLYEQMNGLQIKVNYIHERKVNKDTKAKKSPKVIKEEKEEEEEFVERVEKVDIVNKPIEINKQEKIPFFLRKLR